MKIKNNINGWVNIDKPHGASSAKAVAIIKRLLNAKKAGHAGTLDPLASGILPIAFGEATKTTQFLVNAKKTYQFEVTFGSSTSTDDLEGEVSASCDKIPTREEITAALPSFIGEIMQAPPAYSAIKIDGKRAYKLARSGEKVIIPERQITVYDLKLLSFEGKRASFEVICGKGTYVRSLARDLALKLNSLGHVSILRRTSVGNFCENNTILLANLEDMLHNAQPFDEILSKVLLPVEQVLDDILVLEINETQSKLLKIGRFIEVQNPHSDKLPCAICAGKLIAIGRFEGDIFKPIRVFNH